MKVETNGMAWYPISCKNELENWMLEQPEKILKQFFSQQKILVGKKTRTIVIRKITFTVIQFLVYENRLALLLQTFLINFKLFLL